MERKWKRDGKDGQYRERQKAGTKGTIIGLRERNKDGKEVRKGKEGTLL
jgi:hypothetical protein